MQIYETYKFGKLNEEKNIIPFATVNGGLKIGKGILYFPTEAQMNAAGWYRITNVKEDGEDELVDNIIKHYVGAPVISDEPTEPVTPKLTLEQRVSLLEAQYINDLI